MSTDDMSMQEALIALHAGTKRQGPGDDTFSLELLGKLPASAGWKNYYNPLLDRVDANAGSPSKMMQEVILETRQEIDLFRKFSVYLGYTFFVLKAV